MTTPPFSAAISNQYSKKKNGLNVTLQVHKLYPKNLKKPLVGQKQCNSIETRPTVANIQ
jgi:hypothetical protein